MNVKFNIRREIETQNLSFDMQVRCPGLLHIMEHAAQVGQRPAQRSTSLDDIALGPEQRRDLLARMQAALYGQVNEQGQFFTRAEFHRLSRVEHLRSSKQCEAQLTHLFTLFSR